MFELFDEDFFKFSTGFIAVVVVILIVLGAIGSYKEGVSQHEATAGQQIDEGRD